MPARSSTIVLSLYRSSTMCRFETFCIEVAANLFYFLAQQNCNLLWFSRGIDRLDPSERIAKWIPPFGQTCSRQTTPTKNVFRPSQHLTEPAPPTSSDICDPSVPAAPHNNLQENYNFIFDRTPSRIPLFSCPWRVRTLATAFHHVQGRQPCRWRGWWIPWN